MYGILILLGLAIALFYKYLVWNFGYWRKLGIKEAKSWPLVGSFPSQFTSKRNLVYDIIEMYNKYKNTEYFFGVINTRVPQIVITTPELAYKVFVTDFRCFHDNELGKYLNRKKDWIYMNNSFALSGTEWKESRAEIMPAFTPSRIAAGYPTTLKVCETLSEFIRKQMSTRPVDGLDVKQLFLRFSAEISFEAVLDVKAESFTEGPTKMMTMIEKTFTQANRFLTFSHIAKIFPIIPEMFFVRLFPPDVSQFLGSLMKESLDARRKLGKSGRQDFLDYLLELQQKRNVGVPQLTAHALTVLTNGYESSASAIAHTLLMLARNPDIQTKVRNEIGTEPLTCAELRQLPLLNGCVMETLRLWPVLMTQRKVCTEPCEFVNMDGTKLLLKPGDVVIIPIYAMHMDPELYEDSYEYKPERFLPENGGVKEYMGKGMYFGYGIGPRICTGMHFSFVQVKAAIVEVLRNFDLKLNKRTRNDFLLEEDSTVAQLKGGIWLDFIDRCPPK